MTKNKNFAVMTSNSRRHDHRQQQPLLPPAASTEAYMNVILMLNVKLNMEQQKELSAANNTSHNEKLVRPKIQWNIKWNIYHKHPLISTSASSWN